MGGNSHFIEIFFYVWGAVRKCIWLCFGYVIEFLILIQEMAFVLHKSKQAKTRVPLKKLSKTINCTKGSFYSNEQFCGAVVTGIFDSGRTKFAGLIQF